MRRLDASHPNTSAAHWLRHAKPGYCSETSTGVRGVCGGGEKGQLGELPTTATTWEAAVALRDSMRAAGLGLALGSDRGTGLPRAAKDEPLLATVNGVLSAVEEGRHEGCSGASRAAGGPAHARGP